MPQLEFADFLPQLVWLTISFVVLYLLMSRLALPRIATVLAERDRQIEEDLARAERLKLRVSARLTKSSSHLVSMAPLFPAYSALCCSAHMLA